MSKTVSMTGLWLVVLLVGYDGGCGSDPNPTEGEGEGREARPGDGDRGRSRKKSPATPLTRRDGGMDGVVH